MQLTVAHTLHRGHAAELAQWAASNRMDLIVVHGGDGTVNETINGFLPPPELADGQEWAPLLAVLPGGSANVFARSLGISADPVEATNQLLRLLSVGAHRRIGLGYTDDRWFTFNAGLGLDARVCEVVDAGRSRGRTATPSRYVRTAVREFFREHGSPPRLTVQVGDTNPVNGVHYVFISNSSPWTYLNTRPVHTNPGTTFDGGLGVFAMRTSAVLPTLRMTGQLLAPHAEPKSRKLFRLDDVPSVRVTATEPVPVQVDGDYLGTRERMDFRAFAAALDVVAPAADSR
ncbi:diacylglycerol kinase family protein [Skermania piniformis]